MGKHKYIESPEKMWELFNAYSDEVKKNPIKRTVKGNKDFIVSAEELRRPLTMEGFEIWCFENGVIADLGHYFANTDKAYEDYRTICQLIKKKIRQDQIEGGMAGIYNPSITQRLNNLVEKTENKHEVSEIIIKKQ